MKTPLIPRGFSKFHTRKELAGGVLMGAIAAMLFAQTDSLRAESVERSPLLISSSRSPLLFPTVAISTIVIPPPLSEPPVPVHRTRISARLDPVAHTIQAEGEIQWTNQSALPIQETYWHLYLNAFQHARTAFLRSRLGEGRGGQLPLTWGEIKMTRLKVRSSSAPPEASHDLLPTLAAHSPEDPEDRTDLRSPLPEACAPGETLIFEIAFQTSLPTIVERTGYMGSFHMIGQWFPKLARLRADGSWSHFPFVRLSEFDADFGDYDMTLEVPVGYTVGATGEQVEETISDGIHRTRYVQKNVHDFAWTAWNRFQERTLSLEGVQVRALFPPGHEPAIQRQLDGLGVAMRCMSKRLGSYPYKTLTLVQPPSAAGEAGGMEYPTLITTGGHWTGPPWLRTSEAVTVHEYGHQYFYGLLASDEHRAPFLDEGLNSFLEGICLREGYGAGSLLAVPGLTIDFAAAARWMALPSGHDLAIVGGAAEFPTAGHYARLIYFRTSTLLSTLRASFGESRFDEAFSRYVQAYRFRHPEPADLIASFAVTDPAMAEALEDGLSRRGWIDAAVVDLQPTWGLVVRRGTLRLPMDIRLSFADGSTKEERWDGQSDWIRFDVNGPPELISIEVDPTHKILLDEDFHNNRRSRDPASVGHGTLERASFWGGVLGHLIAP